MNIDPDLVHGLLAEQFPQWAGLPIRAVRSGGTDHAIFRLGDELCVRLPRVEWAIGQVKKEQLWLPRLAPLLPLRIPTPVGHGVRSGEYPWAWSVYEWIEGENPTYDDGTDMRCFATDLAGFLLDLHRVDTTGGPGPGAHNFFRGMPLASRDEAARKAIADLGGQIDQPAVVAAWEESLHAEAHGDPPVWIHGDLQGGNLLVENGKLTAVIDFGGLGVGDPACDLMVAWNLFSSDARQQFRSAVGADDTAWARGRGWALSMSLIALPFYAQTNPSIVAMANRTISEVLSDCSSG